MPVAADERLSVWNDIKAEAPNLLTFTHQAVVNGEIIGTSTSTGYALDLGQKRTPLKGEDAAAAQVRLHLMVAALQADGTTLLELSEGDFVSLGGQRHQIHDPRPFTIARGDGGAEDPIYYDAVVDVGR